MLTISWQEEITSLQKSLKREINKISAGSEINIIKHICISNLKSKLERLSEIETILNIDKYKIVFIGTIGQGKTTAICHIFNPLPSNWVESLIFRRLKRRKLVDFSQSDERALRDQQ